MLSFINNMQHVRYMLRRDSDVMTVSLDNGITNSFKNELANLTPYTVAAFGNHPSASIDDDDLATHNDNAFATFIIGYPDDVFLSHRFLPTLKGSSLVGINKYTKAASCSLTHVMQYIEILMLRNFSNEAIIDRLIERLGLDRNHFGVYDINDYRIAGRAPAPLPKHKVQGYIKPRHTFIVGEY